MFIDVTAPNGGSQTDFPNWLDDQTPAKAPVKKAKGPVGDSRLQIGALLTTNKTLTDFTLKMQACLIGCDQGGVGSVPFTHMQILYLHLCYI